MDRSTLDAKGMLLGWGFLIALWAFCSYLVGIPEYLLASPGRVAGYIAANAQHLAMMVGLTASQALVGWGFGVVGGGLLGAFIFYVPLGRRLALPPLLALQTTPVIALAPLITYWLGFGWWSKVAVAALVATLPVVLAMYSGLGDARPSHIHTFKLAGATEAVIFRRVRLQSAWTSVLSSLKVSIVFAVIGSIVAEFMGGSTGLGFLIMKSIYGSKGAVLISAVLCSALIGQVFLLILERVLSRWESRFAAATH
jgi:ABC-type nitrate/sulfonate/bicarbonate transport system permease component